MYFYIYVIGIDCGPLPDIDNGRVSISPDTRFLSIATYTCNLGFVIDSVQKRRCEANGDYSGSEPSCVGKSPHTIPNVFITYPINLYSC